MEHLLICRVRRATDGAVVLRPGQVLDVAEDHVCRLAVILVVLPAALCRHVGGDAGVDGYVLLARVLVYAQAAQHEKAVAFVQFLR